MILLVDKSNLPTSPERAIEAIRYFVLPQLAQLSLSLSLVISRSLLLRNDHLGLNVIYDR